jgi:hypothetical protein
MIGRALGVAAVLTMVARPALEAAPKKKPAKKAPAKPTGVPIKWDDECQARFLEDPKQYARANPYLARARLEPLDLELVETRKLTDSEPKVQKVVSLLSRYWMVLANQDPYSAQATLGIAIGYDMVFKKGCALRMLRRLGELERHPAFMRAARQAIDDVDSTPSYFTHYRKEALSAMGR